MEQYINELLSTFELRLKTELHTIITCKVVAINNDRVDVRPVYKGVKLGSKKRRQLETGELVLTEDYELPIIINCPIVMLVNSIARITIPINIGDTGLLLVHERDINNWKDMKDDTLDTLRKFNVNDGFFLPFVNQKIENYSTDSIDIKYKNTEFKITENSIEATGNMNVTGDVKVTGAMEITGNLKVDSALEVTGNLKVDGDTTLKNIDFAMHKHTYVSPGGPAVTGVPQ